MTGKDAEGALFFWDDEPHITGFLVIGDERYELVGVRRSPIRTDFTGRRIKVKQMDLFDDPCGDGAG